MDITSTSQFMSRRSGLLSASVVVLLLGKLPELACAWLIRSLISFEVYARDVSGSSKSAALQQSPSTSSGNPRSSRIRARSSHASGRYGWLMMAFVHSCKSLFKRESSCSLGVLNVKNLLSPTLILVGLLAIELHAFSMANKKR